MINDQQSINLIPEGRRLQLPINWDYLLLLLVFTVLTVISGQYFERITTKKKLTRSLASLSQERSALQKKVIDVRGRSSADESNKKQKNLIKQIIGKRMGWEDIFKELGIITPKGTWLTDFLAKSSSGKILVAMQGETTSQANMARFFSAIEKSDHFADVLLISSEIQNEMTPPSYKFNFAAPGVVLSQAEENKKVKK